MDKHALAVGALPPSQLGGGGGHMPPVPPHPGSYAYASLRSEPTTHWAIKLRLCLQCSYKHIIINTANISWTFHESMCISCSYEIHNSLSVAVVNSWGCDFQFMTFS